MVEDIKIGGKIFPVEIKDSILEGGEAYAGRIRYSEPLIEIQKKDNYDYMLETLVHECVHGISNYSNTELDEDTVDMFSKNLYMFLKDNPVLLKEILKQSSLDFERLKAIYQPDTAVESVKPPRLI